ncbi:MAG: VWA domain-containing protein [Bdellovibrionaceae bacterium]|nr:VWA domain-containing protein [Pseudobdellovibrionaceae bacterium]
MFRFESPQYLTLVLLSLFLVLVFLIALRRWKKITNTHFSARLSPFLFQAFSLKKSWIKTICLSLALAGFALALSRPQMGEGQKEVKSMGLELMIAVDVSRSMLAEDVRPSRLEHAKKEIMNLLEKLSGDKVGLIAFAGSSVLLSPLTVDKSALKMFVEGLSPNSVETQGTEIGKALDEAEQAFKRGGVEGDETSQVTKVVLVISDGEDHEKGAEVAAKKLLENGIRVFTMAFGTEAGGKVAIRDERGNLLSYLKDKSGQIVTSKVNGDFLRTVAEVGNGSFYHVTFGGGQMTSLVEDLDQLEKAEFDTTVATSYDERFQFFLLPAILLALFELFLGTRVRNKDPWKGRFPV